MTVTVTVTSLMILRSWVRIGMLGERGLNFVVDFLSFDDVNRMLISLK